MVEAEQETGHEVGPEEAAQLATSGEAQLVDVRQDYEWEAGHIEGAIHVPLEQLPARAEELDSGKRLIFVCRSGGRSAMATSAFRESGYDGHNLLGGMEAWVEAGQPIVPDGGVVAGPRPDNS